MALLEAAAATSLNRNATQSLIIASQESLKIEALQLVNELRETTPRVRVDNTQSLVQPCLGTWLMICESS